jgi:hypothetical protein
MTVITKQRSQTIEEVEKLLLIWINDNTLGGNSISEGMVSGKARRLHDEMVKKYLGTRGNTDVLKASRRSFEKLKTISGIPLVLRHGVVVSANQKQLNNFCKILVTV